jgi:Flp pilus assembly protein TadD
MRTLAAFLLVCCACAHAPTPPQPLAHDPAAERRRLFELPATLLRVEARELMAQGKWQAAQDRLEAYLSKEPGNAEGLFDAGWVSERLADPKRARSFYRQALASQPGHAGAALNLARLLGDEPADAEAVLRTALRERPADPALLNGLAAVLRSAGKLEPAAGVVRQVLERHPRDAQAWRNLAAIEADRGHPRLAESALNNARRLDPKDAGILNSLGLLALGRQDVAAARGWFEEATRLDPAFAPAWVNLGALALRYRDYALAEQAYLKATELDPARWESHLGRAWALEGLRRPREARGEYEKVLAAEAHQDDALFGKALALKAEGDLGAALAAFKEYAALPRPGHLKEAQNQLAAIDLRLRHSPLPGGTPRSAAAGLDLSKLPQAADAQPSAEQRSGADGPAVVR